MAVFNLHSHFFLRVVCLWNILELAENSFSYHIYLKIRNAKNHTHLQFAPANASPKIAKEYVLPTLNPN